MGCDLQGPTEPDHQGPEVSKGFVVRHWGATGTTKESGGGRFAFQDCCTNKQDGLGWRHFPHLAPLPNPKPPEGKSAFPGSPPPG